MTNTPGDPEAPWVSPDEESPGEPENRRDVPAKPGGPVPTDVVTVTDLSTGMIAGGPSGAAVTREVPLTPGGRPGSAAPTRETPVGEAVRPGAPVRSGGVPPGDGSAQTEGEARTREVPRPSDTAAVPADLPMLTRELPAPGHDLPKAASDRPEAVNDVPEAPGSRSEAANDVPEETGSRSGPWDAVVAPFTAPATRHDQSAPRYRGRAARTAESRGEPPAEPLPPGGHPPSGTGGWPTPGPAGQGNGPASGGAPIRPAAGPPGGRTSGMPMDGTPSGPHVGPPGGPVGGRAPGEGRRRMTMAIVAAGVAVVVAGGIAFAFGRLGGASRPQAGCAGEACSRTGSAAAGPRFRYRTVERDTGYFEGTVTLANRGATPWRSWTLTFTYPGADVHNAWEVVLRQTGQNVAIASAPTAEPIAPGDDFEVRFGGAGRPGMPTNCRFNGAPCTFVR
ncbi:cellulose binding domain-containing protein [Actinoallomurus iriomotensis]|uniref:CBM2 domain-containing protein n=1 Tax=Actinoallomurus iriomotensis TaxID=478107 RepID=A0A9W6RBS2_9ACTN|nr:cellulose binding domain-containing protein [Actinoallomurus iriomotensis]GLY72748.1 hypothetical protein Airi01_010150 [Actinoallomurus iriomotensis]